MKERLIKLLDIVRQNVSPTPEVLAALQEMDMILEFLTEDAYGTTSSRIQ